MQDAEVAKRFISLRFSGDFKILLSLSVAGVDCRLILCWCCSCCSGLLTAGFKIQEKGDIKQNVCKKKDKLLFLKKTEYILGPP
jgi:hypothetical protein